MALTAEQLLAEARVGLARLDPRQAAVAVDAGALLIDVRTHEQRVAGGVAPAAWLTDLNVLEWRVDPASPSRDPRVGADTDRLLIVLCEQGFCSSLAAARLQRLGFVRATDVVGGFRAWVDAGLPAVPFAG